MIRNIFPVLVAVTLLQQSAFASNGSVSIPPELTYLLPPQYKGALQQGFVDTHTTDASSDELLANARNTPFIAYDHEFLDIIGPTPTMRLVAERPSAFAGEAGVWVPERREVWFTSNTNGDNQSLQIVDLDTWEIRVPKTSLPILNPNGGCYANGTVYITSGGTLVDAPCVFAINPSTGDTSIIVNTFFGLAFNGPNDVTWTTRANKAYMFFTDDPISVRYGPGGESAPQLPDAVWRFDPVGHSLVPVISRGDVLIPNGIRVNADQTKLYVTDSSATNAFPALAGGASGIGSPAIYVFDLDENMFPVNKKMFGISRTGLADGIHVDDRGRVWTAEYEGVVVRSPSGKVLGVFNSFAYSVNATTHVANFALAGNQLVILDVQRIWRVELAQTVISPR